jgi:hypothetical protein
LPVQTKRDLIASAWESLDCPAVGAKELEQIQTELGRVFGEARSDSPAAIARILADEGAELKHPEILECDSRWRERQVSNSVSLDFGSLAEALASVARLQELRNSDQETADQETILKEQIVAVREDCRRRAVSLLLEERERAEAKEIASWLGVWLNTPDLFADWLELRRLSPQFLKKFGQV